MSSQENLAMDAFEAADYLGLSASWLAKLRLYGGGPVFCKLGKRVLYLRRDLDDWRDCHRKSSTSQSADQIRTPWASPSPRVGA